MGGAGGRTFTWRWVSRVRRAHLERLWAGETSPYVRFGHFDCVQTIKMQTQRFVWRLVPSTFTLPVPPQTTCHRMQANTALQTSISRQHGSAGHLALADHWASSTPYWHRHDCRRETRAQAHRIARPVHCASETRQCSPTTLATTVAEQEGELASGGLTLTEWMGGMGSLNIQLLPFRQRPELRHVFALRDSCHRLE